MSTFYRLDLSIKSTFMNIFFTSSFSKLGFVIEFFLQQDFSPQQLGWDHRGHQHHGLHCQLLQSWTWYRVFPTGFSILFFTSLLLETSSFSSRQLLPAGITRLQFLTPIHSPPSPTGSHRSHLLAALIATAFTSTCWNIIFSSGIDSCSTIFNISSSPCFVLSII